MMGWGIKLSKIAWRYLWMTSKIYLDNDVSDGESDLFGNSSNFNLKKKFSSKSIVQ